jgi:hypothetical protein
MARGTADFNINNYSYASTNLDIAQISNMLWGFSPVDGLGRVIYFDTFNNGMAGVRYQTLGAGSVPVLANESNAKGQIIIPPNGVLCNPGTTANDYSGIVRRWYLGKQARIGFEVGICQTDTSPAYQLMIDYKPNGLNAYIARLFYSHTTGTWSILDNNNIWQSIFVAGVPLGGNQLLAQVKIVADWTTGNYVRLYIGDLLFDISKYTMPLSSNTYDGYLSTTCQCVSYGAGTSAGVISYLLVTKDEP